ncbi:MAG: S24 family peptidase, partial [Candidatus Paceibacterota bacterium]
VSPRIAERKSSDGLIVVRAIGSSLNMANIKGKSIEDGDYVIVDCRNRNPEDGDYVLSVIDGVANMKRFYRGENEIRLVSESTSEIPPIVIHEDDNYMINGVILMVVKKN